MPDQPRLNQSGESAAMPDIEADAERLAQVRDLLVGPELQDMRNRLGAHAEDIAAVLPRAVSLREKQDDQLSRALASTVEGAIQTSVKNNPQPMIDAVFPVIGPAIRKAVSDAMARAVQSLNTALEHSLSVRSIKWRIEAARTGKSFAEVVLLHTLKFRVEQVFLIHKESGLLMQHLTADGVDAEDEQLVAAMFTAITDFVRDSFHADPAIGLRNLRVGEVSVWVERGPQAVLAVAVRGTGPESLRGLLQETLEDIHRAHADRLDVFKGDQSQMAVAQPQLERCLIVATEADEKRKASPGLVLVTLGVAVLVLALIVAAWVSNRRWADYIERLETTPGVMLVGEDHDWWGRSSVKGLYDPDAALSPQDILEASGLSSDEVVQRWVPFPGEMPVSAEVFLDAAAEGE
ncbi:MAG: hypothetical protein AAF333_09185 [Planctomycetota bacterium]